MNVIPTTPIIGGDMKSNLMEEIRKRGSQAPFNYAFKQKDDGVVNATK